MKYWTLAAALISAPVNAQVIEWSFSSLWHPGSEYNNSNYVIAQGTLIFDTDRAVITTLRFESERFLFENAADLNYTTKYYHPNDDITGDIFIDGRQYELTNGQTMYAPQFHVLRTPPGGVIEETLSMTYTYFYIAENVSSEPIWQSIGTSDWKRIYPAPIPEPSPVALLALGIAGLVCSRRKNNKND